MPLSLKAADYQFTKSLRNTNVNIEGFCDNCHRCNMFKNLFLLCFLSLNLILAPGLFSQGIEDIKFGLYGRTEQNIYRYYNGLTKGNFHTQRVTNGYSAGFILHASVNYLFNAGMSLGLAEASYAPNMTFDKNTLWSVNLRLWQYDFWGELKFGQRADRGGRFLLGGEFMMKDYKREIWSLGKEGYPSWPQTRFMPRIGVSYEYTLKKKWLIEPNAGMRLAFYNQVGYDYTLNQFFAGINLAYKLKSW